MIRSELSLAFTTQWRGARDLFHVLPREEGGKHHSLVAHVYIFNILDTLSDVERASFLHPDCSEIVAKKKHALIYFLERAGKRDFFDSAALKARFIDAFHAIRYLDTPEIFTVCEHIFPDYL